MGIGEAHAFSGEAVEVGRLDPAALFSKALDVAVAEVVSEDEDDVGQPVRRDWGRKRHCEREEHADPEAGEKLTVHRKRVTCFPGGFGFWSCS